MDMNGTGYEVGDWLLGAISNQFRLTAPHMTSNAVKHQPMLLAGKKILLEQSYCIFGKWQILFAYEATDFVIDG